MAGKRTEMSKIKQILLLHKDGMSNRKIGERLGLYKETVNKYVNAAKSDSKSIEELIKMDEPELQHRFSAGNAAYSDKRFDALQEDLEYYVRELERRNHYGRLIRVCSKIVPVRTVSSVRCSCCGTFL